MVELVDQPNVGSAHEIRVPMHDKDAQIVWTCNLLHARLRIRVDCKFCNCSISKKGRQNKKQCC